jgi:hypothetical protein
MAVFSYIAAAIVNAFVATAGSILGSTLLFNTVVGVIAGGLAFATAKVLGVFEPPDLGPDPGVKIQLAPSTDNKIGIAYGRNFMSGPITDVAISNQNDTMHYCITLSERVIGGTYVVNEIFRDTSTLNFSSGNASVNSQTNPNSTNVSTIAGKIRCRVYAGGTASTNQIFPTTNKVAATTMMPHWTNTTDYSMEELVFAMVEVDYDAENGLTGLGGMTFDITNSISNPGDVLIDYLNNTRYGAGLANTSIDVTSITGAANTSLKGYSAEQISYTPFGGGSATQDRWQINGYLSTFADASTNIAKICQASASFFLFDTKQGKFKVLPNRTASSTFSLNDDNIVSKVGVSGTELYSLYNKYQIEYNDKDRRDQTNTIQISTPASELNTGEPENMAQLRLDLVNDPIRATQIANLDLTQSRNGMIVTCTADYTAMQVDAGDVVDLTNADYGFTAKEFRVMKAQEQLDDSGMINVALTLLEYNADVYTQPAVTAQAPQLPIDIPTIPITPIVIPGVFNGTYGNVTLNQSSYGNVVVNESMKVFGAGAQLEDAGLDTGTGNIASGTTPIELITPQLYDLTDSDPGDYSFTAEGSLGGTITGAYDVGFNNNVTLTFANATNVQNITYGGGGVVLQGVTDFAPQVVDVKKVSTDPVANGLSASDNYKIANATVRLQGFSTIDASAGAKRRFGNMGYAMTRITKGEK